MYETLSQIAQTWGLIAFIVAFALVLVYALSPSNKSTFDRAGRMPLDDDNQDTGSAERG